VDKERLQTEVGAKTPQLEIQESDLRDRTNENIRLQGELQTLSVSAMCTSTKPSRLYTSTGCQFGIDRICHYNMNNVIVYRKKWMLELLRFSNRKLKSTDCEES